MAESIQFDDVSYRYGRRPNVIDGLSWVVPVGKTVLLGPNGAGKSTLLMLAAGVYRPRTGHCVLGDLDSRNSTRDYRARVGVMPQRATATKGLTVREHVSYAGWLKGMSRSAAWQASVGALEQVGLQGHAQRPSQALSGGEMRRMALAAALAPAPDVLLLDEPTAGLDPAERVRFRRVLSELPRDVDVLVSTHQVDDLHEVYTTVAVLAQGRVTFEGTIAGFEALAGDGAADGSSMERAYAASIAGAP